MTDISMDLIFPPLIFMIGLVGASIGFLVFTLRKKLKNIGPVNMYKYLLITDNFYLLQVFLFYLASTFGVKIYLVSRETCKLLSYVRFLATPLSPMLLVYISMERYFSIKYPKMRYTLRQDSTQLLYLAAVIIYNIIFYIPILFIFDIETLDISINSTKNSSELTPFCLNKSPLVAYYMDIVNRVIIPFVLMSVSSFLLIDSIFKSRRRVISKYTSKELEKIKKDVNFAISSVSLNLFYLALNLPFSIMGILNDFDIWSHNILNLNFALTFFILFTNSLFRSEFILMIKSFFSSLKQMPAEISAIR